MITSPTLLTPRFLPLSWPLAMVKKPEHQSSLSAPEMDDYGDIPICMEKVTLEDTAGSPKA